MEAISGLQLAREARQAQAPTRIQRFELVRNEDVSGVSGTGIVAVGAVFPSGRCIIEWLPGPNVDVRSVVVYDAIEELHQVNGHGGRTVVQWVDDGRDWTTDETSSRPASV